MCTSNKARWKQSARGLLLLGLLLWTTACGNGSGGAKEPASSSTGTAAAPLIKTAQAAERNGKLTQQEVEKKMRIDKKEFQPILELATLGPIIPGLHEQVIPQGLAYAPDEGWLVMSGYREKGGVSVLALLDAKSGALVKSFELYEGNNKPYTGHAGGAAVTPGYVWIASGGEARYVSIEALNKAEDGGKVVFEGSLKTGVRASNVAYEDGLLWVGEFAHGTEYPTDKSHYLQNRDGEEYRAWMEGYAIDAQTGLPPKLAAGAESPVPEAILSIPNRIQGMSLWKGHWILSDSFGRNAESTVLFYSDPRKEAPHTEVKIGEASVPVWFLDGKALAGKLDGPPMAEELAVIDDSLYILYESGSEKFVTSGSYAMDTMHVLDMNIVQAKWMQ
ncbi:hypothetical protein [Paenibacillus sp. OSY-SE]|uniref:hypothetical protein n=1 Tax=Paenibacillus sp. OSY-SE TaxID=1196323 RepID=UPI0002FD4F5A|nr:hypothetical protein [Paenibacillus sp. OSY-SE]